VVGFRNAAAAGILDKQHKEMQRAEHPHCFL
jgi:hypothetical protein